ncbi:MAG: hypothetical protein WC477_06475 [Patescibacteria group bacterium]
MKVLKLLFNYIKKYIFIFINLTFANSRPILLFGAFAVIIYFSRVYLTKVLAFSDFEPFTQTFSASFKGFIYVWDVGFSGYFAPKSLFAPLKALALALSFNQSLIAQDLFLLFIFVIGVCGMYRLLRTKLLVSRQFSLISGFFFVFNPVSISGYANGALAILLLYSLIPWLFYYFDEILSKYSLRKGILFSIIVSIYLINLQTAFWIVLGLPIFAFFYFIYFGIKRSDNFKILRICLHGLLALLINLISIFFIFSNIK